MTLDEPFAAPEPSTAQAQVTAPGSVTAPESFAAPPALVEHARRFYAGDAQPVPARPAATVLLLRPAADPAVGGGSGAASAPGEAFEVYVLRRAATMTFGGVYAFPGGSVDPADSTPGLGWAGPTPQQWGQRLGLPDGQAQAVVCAAAREVFEEAGVLLAGPHPGTVVGDVSDDSWEEARQDLVKRRVGFADLLRDRQLLVRSDLLLPWVRWITPEFEPRRFDTYFFLALLPQGQRTRDVSGEADHTMWVRPSDALARAMAGKISMLPPTMVTLAEVAGCGSLAEVPAVSAGRDLTTPILPRMEFAPDGSAHFRLT